MSRRWIEWRKPRERPCSWATLRNWGPRCSKSSWISRACCLKCALVKPNRGWAPGAVADLTSGRRAGVAVARRISLRAFLDAIGRSFGRRDGRHHERRCRRWEIPRDLSGHAIGPVDIGVGEGCGALERTIELVGFAFLGITSE